MKLSKSEVTKLMKEKFPSLIVSDCANQFRIISWWYSEIS
jgi:hypothetical protein